MRSADATWILVIYFLCNVSCNYYKFISYSRVYKQLTNRIIPDNIRLQQKFCISVVQKKP